MVSIVTSSFFITFSNKNYSTLVDNYKDFRHEQDKPNIRVKSSLYPSLSKRGFNFENLKKKRCFHFVNHYLFKVFLYVVYCL